MSPYYPSCIGSVPLHTRYSNRYALSMWISSRCFALQYNRSCFYLTVVLAMVMMVMLIMMSIMMFVNTVSIKSDSKWTVFQEVVIFLCFNN